MFAEIFTKKSATVAKYTCLPPVKNLTGFRCKIPKAAGSPRRSARIFRRTGVPVSAQCSLRSFSARARQIFQIPRSSA
jgi:hypothetical protein